MIKFNKKVALITTFSILLVFFYLYLKPSCSKKDGAICNINIKGTSLELEVAYSEDKQAKGLMYVDHLDENKGMIFIYDKSRYLTFWMKNTYLALSIAYVDQDGLITDIINMYPIKKNTTNDQIPRYSSSKMVKYAIEVNQGWFTLRGVREGDHIKIPDELR